MFVQFFYKINSVKQNCENFLKKLKFMPKKYFFKFPYILPKIELNLKLKSYQNNHLILAI